MELSKKHCTLLLALHIHLSQSTTEDREGRKERVSLHLSNAGLCGLLLGNDPNLQQSSITLSTATMDFAIGPSRCQPTLGRTFGRRCSHLPPVIAFIWEILDRIAKNPSSWLPSQENWRWCRCSDPVILSLRQSVLADHGPISFGTGETRFDRAEICSISNEFDRKCTSACWASY